MFDYTHDHAQSNEMLRLVLVELRALNLPPNPSFFTLFYERALKRDASLNKDIDDAINNDPVSYTHLTLPTKRIV